MISLLPILSLKSFLFISLSKRLESFHIWQNPHHEPTSWSHNFFTEDLNSCLIGFLWDSASYAGIPFDIVTSQNFDKPINWSLYKEHHEPLWFIKIDYNEKTTNIREDRVTGKMIKYHEEIKFKKGKQKKQQISKQEYNN